MFTKMMDMGMGLWDEPDVISSDDSSSESDVVISDAFQANRSTEVRISQPPKELASEEGALMKRAEMYQEYMKQIPIPSLRGSVIPFSSWTGLGRSVKQVYGQPLHYLTNAQLRQWDQARIGTEDESPPLDWMIHPSKAEATVWLLEEIHRRTTSHDYMAKLWLSDPMHHVFVDPVFPKLGEA